MKFYELTIIMLMFNVFGSALTNAGLFTAMGLSANITSHNPSAEDIQAIKQDVEGSISDQITDQNTLEQFFGFVSKVIVEALSAVFKPLEKYIFWPAIIMAMFGIPSQVGYAFTIVFNLVQAIGLLQFITGRSLKDSE